MQILDGHTEPVYALAFSPDGYWLASGGEGKCVQVWDGSGQLFRQLGPADIFSRPCYSLDFAPTGHRFVATSFGGIAESDLTSDQDCVGRLGRKVGTAISVKYVSDFLVAVGCGERAKQSPGHLCLYDLKRGEVRKPQFNEPYGVRCVAVHQLTKKIAWSNGSRRVSVWPVTKPDAVHLNLTHNAPAIAFHPGGTELAVAEGWGVMLYDLAHRKDRLTLKGHKGTVAAVAFSPDGRTLATGSWDETVRLWDPDTGAERAAFRWPTGKVYAVAFSPDGTRLAAAGSSGSVVVWDVD